MAMVLVMAVTVMKVVKVMMGWVVMSLVSGDDDGACGGGEKDNGHPNKQCCW